MKNTLFFVLIFAVVFTACKKESINDNTIMKSTSKIEQRILNFEKKLNSGLKDETTYATDSAVWYVEGLLNYKQANNAHNFYRLSYHRDSLFVNTSNGEFSIGTLHDAYDYFDDVINGILAATNDPGMNIDLVDINLTESGLKDGSALMEITVCTGWGTQINYVLFGENEDWYWGQDLGACGNNTSTEVTDAADLLEYKFNHPISVGQGGWFSDVECVDEIHGDDTPYYVNNNPGPYCNSMIFFYYSGSPQADDPCIEHEELNFYLSKFDDVKAYNQPIGKSFKSVEIRDDQIYGMGNENFFHLYDIYYGVFNANPH